MSYVFWLCQTATVLQICVIQFRYKHSQNLTCVSAQAVFARGISAVWENYICVGKCCIEGRGGCSKSAVKLSFVWSVFAGVSSGVLLVFDIPSKGSNITLSEVLEQHQEAITDLASECSGSQVW